MSPHIPKIINSRFAAYKNIQCQLDFWFLSYTSCPLNLLNFITLVVIRTSNTIYDTLSATLTKRYVHARCGSNLLAAKQRIIAYYFMLLHRFSLLPDTNTPSCTLVFRQSQRPALNLILTSFYQIYYK